MKPTIEEITTALANAQLAVYRAKSALDVAMADYNGIVEKVVGLHHEAVEGAKAAEKKAEPEKPVKK